MAIDRGSFRIISTGRFTPPGVLSNNDLEKIVDTSDEWISSRTGIKERRITNGQTTSDLATLAAKNAIDKVGYDINKFDIIITATCTPDMRSPSVACLVLQKLGLEKPGIMTFDINAACTGFVYALNVAEKLLHSGTHKSALVIGAETLSRVTDFKDRNTCVLFGDGAGAVILEKDETKEVIFNMSSKPDNNLILTIDDYVSMDGPKVYQFASRVINSSVEEILAFGKIEKTDISRIIPHQANIRIIQSASKALKIPLDKFFVNIHKYGNTSAASIPIALDEMLETETVKPDEKIIMVGFGAGLTYGAVSLTY